MKKISTLVFAVASMIAFGQNISDYRYIAIPQKFETFKKDQYGLDGFLAKALKGKKYTVLQGNVDQWPVDAKNNSCNILNADIIDNSSLLRNRIVLEFKDCHGKVIQSIKASSGIKEYKEGFEDALRQTIVSVPVANPTVNLAAVSASETPEKTVVVTPESGTITSTPAAVSGTSNKYSNGKTELQRVQIDNTQFILVQQNSSVPFATFKETTKKDVYRVKLENGSSTTGYIENGNIIIEFPQADGEYSKEVFSRK